MLTNDYKKGIIALFYLVDLFKDLLVIPISYNGFEHSDGKSLQTIVNINLESMRIIIFLDTSPGAVI